MKITAYKWHKNEMKRPQIKRSSAITARLLLLRVVVFYGCADGDRCSD